MPWLSFRFLPIRSTHTRHDARMHASQRTDWSNGVEFRDKNLPRILATRENIEPDHDEEDDDGQEKAVVFGFIHDSILRQDSLLFLLGPSIAARDSVAFTWEKGENACCQELRLIDVTSSGDMYLNLNRISNSFPLHC